MGGPRPGEGSRPPDTPPSAPVAEDLPALKGAADSSKKGALNINAAPQARVLVDGKPVGRTPQIGLPVDPGRHTVVFVFADGRQKKQTVTVGPGQTVTAGDGTRG
ncbi:MAG: PEGA domain-containing protein [Polyangiaceae bacterium]